MAQIWADQCANVIYFHNSDMYPRIFHERGFERTTSRFHSPPGVGQNVAWALTKHVNFTRIIDDLWYRDINKLKPGRIGDFQVRTNHNLLNNGISPVLFKIVLGELLLFEKVTLILIFQQCSACERVIAIEIQ